MDGENSSEEEISVTRSELEEIIDRRVEQKLKQKEKETVKNQNQKLTRRRFLKMAGLGAGAIGFSTLGTSWFSVNQNTGGGSSTLSKVLSNGNDVNGQNIVDNGTTIWDTNNQEIPSSQVQNLDSHTSNTSTHTTSQTAKQAQQQHYQTTPTTTAHITPDTRTQKQSQQSTPKTPYQ